MTCGGVRYRPFDLPGLPSVEDALTRWVSALPSPEPPLEVVDLWHAAGRVLAEDAVAADAVPSFARSLVDGVALRWADGAGATVDHPRILRIVGQVPMGQAAEFQVDQGQGALIPTGGMLPRGADAVVKVEDFPELLSADPAETPEKLFLRRIPEPAENVAPPGADIQRGQRILGRGHRLRPQDVGVLAGIGAVSVRVYRRPEVAILSTGNEVAPPEGTPGPGRIRDMNAVALAASVEAAGGIPRRLGIAPDHRGRLRELMEEGLASDMLVLSGGSSVGEDDWTARLLADFGPPGIVVHGVKLAPGKPTLCALAGDRPVLGLPGNPVSALVVFRLFGEPALRRMAGEKPPPGWEAVVPARMAEAAAGLRERDLHLRVSLEPDGAGEWLARPVRGGSNQMMTMVQADGTVLVPAGKILDEGTPVQVHPWTACPARRG